MRVLAVKMEDGLFDEVKDHIKEKGLTVQKLSHSRKNRQKKSGKNGKNRSIS